MLQLPALRELEIYTRIDSRSGLPFTHASAMQRNKVVFDCRIGFPGDTRVSGTLGRALPPLRLAIGS